MKKLIIFRNRIRLALSNIHLVDKCLIIFMIILLLESAYQLFFGSNIGKDAGNIDVIIRTSTAAIFGYLLSTNFIRHIPTNARQNHTTKNTASIPVENSNALQSRIGFSTPDTASSEEKLEFGGTSTSSEEVGDEATASRLQIIIAAIIGLFCLSALIILHNIPNISETIAKSSSISATIVQFRDIISGCIGFLIGCPTSAIKS